MRPAVLLLALAVCKPPSAAPPPPEAGRDPIAALAETAAHQARKGFFRESSRTYRQMADLRPSSPARCRWQLAVVRNTLAMGEKRQVVEEIQRLAALDRLFRVTAVMPADVTRECHLDLHDTLAELVFVWNREMTTGCTAYAHHNWPLLETLLHEFLADFPGDAWAPEVRGALQKLHELES
ncbi:MAG TPA: hypothetical protein VN903_31950 [Polyangia bacterium]|nr:hypothetical protein [Polyangia bacterium]